MKTNCAGIFLRSLLFTFYRTRPSSISLVPATWAAAHLGPGITPVHIHQISQELEGIEGDTDRESDALNELRDIAKDGTKQSGVFKIPDQGDINGTGDKNPKLSASRKIGFFHLQRTEPGSQCHEHQKQNVFRFTPGVEDQGENERTTFCACWVRHRK